MRVVLFARYPEPGHAKTRLIPALGSQGAAALHARLTERAIRSCTMSGLPFAVAATGAPRQRFENWLGPVALIEQRQGDLGMRMAAIETPVVIIGSDIPDLTPAHLRGAAEAVAQGRVALGPALDGGYWLIGLPAPMPWLFEVMLWGTGVVFEETVARLTARGETPVLLEPLADLDRPEDLARWPGLT